MITAIGIYLLLVAGTSAGAFLAYWLDKRLAQSGGRRISEKNLILFAVLGGWPGAWAAQQVFRHKTQKTSFQIKFWLAVAVHVGMVGFLAYLWWTR
ncbi:DUF1294 domain-containing protein [Blastopirellula marina]|uniref:DUF1294 domain-containing protein n=1 Tax=Blastopirellula marina TaxID=124 RepID=A0A2S8GQT7_9BACT|nr:DUF1294 domain-containing protein [Blastopirellula marina]PQO35599.1 DUF1294 domain-containing protein [Blastopirellula marina]PQO46799.1 DUF1294 domain-containing protein [Blastopirellula marina]PTL44239.1 DUF1294 domain-containing protein [Blastopirellula marina]